jgi:hypothetical protein
VGSAPLSLSTPPFFHPGLDLRDVLAWGMSAPVSWGGCLERSTTTLPSAGPQTADSINQGWGVLGEKNCICTEHIIYIFLSWSPKQ